MKLDTNTTRKILELLSLKNRIKLVNFHGVILGEEIPVKIGTLQVSTQRVHVSARHLSED